MSPGNPFILGSKGQGHESQKHCHYLSLHSCEYWILLLFHCVDVIGTRLNAECFALV